MIITVTLNPAIDKTLEIETFNYGGLNRIISVEKDIGGKGINVSKTIAALGGETIALGFISGSSGREVKSYLDRIGIKNYFIETKGETRTNTKLYEKSGTVTEINEPGPSVTKNDITLLFDLIKKYCTKDSLFVLSGSVPKGCSPDIYKEITELVHSKGGMVLLDADGELFKEGIKAKPDIIKPNKTELEAFIGKKLNTENDRELINACTPLKKYTENIALSLGSEGAIFMLKGKTAKCNALNVDVKSTVGAGDAMAAALAIAVEKGLDLKETIILAMASSAGAVTTQGTKPPSLEIVKKLSKKVVIKDI